MKNFKSKAIVLASLAGLALSSVAFATVTSDYNDAVKAAKDKYKARVVTCKGMAAADQGGCIKDAKATRKADNEAAIKARNADPRWANKSSVEQAKEGPGAH